MENIEIAITLGIKEELRGQIDEDDLPIRVYELFKRIGYRYICFSREKYSTTGVHIHIYYIGKPIYWIDFNKYWGLGYVKNRYVYNTQGWIDYIKKFGCYWEFGKKVETSMIQRFVGHDIEKEILLNQNITQEDENEIHDIWYDSDYDIEKPDIIPDKS